MVFPHISGRYPFALYPLGYRFTPGAPPKFHTGNLDFEEGE